MRFAFPPIHLIHDPLVRIDQRRQFRQQQPPDGEQIALPLQHAREFRDIRLQPILFVVALRRVAQVADHRVDVVLQFGNFSPCVHLDRARQISFGHRSGHFGDGAHLRGEIRRQKVHVVCEMLPCPRSARNVGLPAQPAFHADFARHRDDLLREDR